MEIIYLLDRDWSFPIMKELKKINNISLIGSERMIGDPLFNPKIGKELVLYV
jgi:hypothetical protein